MELSVDGRTVFAATGGKPFDPAAPAIVFIHGSGGDHTVWALQTRYFAWHGSSVLAIDLPGHGRSDGPVLETIDALADWTVRLLDAAGVETAAIVGHSLGALVALEAAARYPDRVRAIALLGVAERMAVHPELLAASRAEAHLAYELITAWGYARRSHLGGQRMPGMWMTGGTVRLLERSRPGVLAADLAACEDFAGAPAAAAKVTCPALFVLGVSDRMTAPAAAAPLAEKIAGSRTIMVPDAGHFLMIEQPDRTLDALREIL
jgi:pimeloyl-ACP methyl ester carboxylesterase